MSKDVERKRKNIDFSELLENILVGIIIIFLSMHLFTVHSKLLFHLNPDKLVKDLVYIFDKTLFTKELIVSTIGAIAFSLITALILTIFVRYRKVFIIAVSSFAFLDGIGVFVYYNITLAENIFIISGAIYYAIYTATIIVSLGLFRYLKYSNANIHENNIEEVESFDVELSESILEDDIWELRSLMQNIQTEYSQNNNENNITQTRTMDILEKKVLHLSHERELTQKEIAKELQISQPQVSRILSKHKRDKKSIPPNV